MSKAFVMLSADRVEHGEIREVAGALQQEHRLFQGGSCVCVLLVTFPPGSPEWERWSAARTLDGMSTVRADSIASDATDRYGADHPV
jgi:hypothetical protein